MTKEQKFYKALQDVFIGTKIEGKGGFVNLMKIKPNYYRKIEEIPHLNTLPSNDATPLKKGNNIPDSFIEGKEGNSPSMRGWTPKSDRVVKWYNLPYNPNLKEKARKLRKAGNLSEVLFWNKVKNKQFLNLDFDRQKIIGNYIVDFYCKNLGVIIEIDGVSHDGKIEYDEQRDNYLRSLGLKIIHISDLDVKKNLEGVLIYLKDRLTNTLSANADTPLKEGNNTLSANADTPLKEGNNSPSK